MSMLLWLSLVIATSVLLFAVYRFRAGLRGALGNAKSFAHADLSVARVLACEQTGETVKRNPLIRMRVRVEENGSSPRELELTQPVSVGSIPRIGEQVYVAIDRRKPDQITYAGMLHAFQAMGAPEAKPMAPLAPQPAVASSAINLRENKRLAVGRILAAEIMAGAIRYTIEIDSILSPRRVVSFQQKSFGAETYEPGDRAYLFLSESDAGRIALVPLSYTGGAKLRPEESRLDPLVLGPELLTLGARATGVVLSVQEVPRIEHSRLVSMRRFRLKMLVTPEDGSPTFEIEQPVSFTAEDRVERICRIGAVVPLRYDRKEPTCLTTDALALGYANPYESVLRAFEAARRSSEEPVTH